MSKATAEELTAINEVAQHKPPALWTKQFVTLTLSTFLLFLNLQMLITTYSMHIKTNLYGGDMQVSMATSIFAAAAIVARLLTGRLIKRWSKDSVLTLGIILAGAATALSALPESVTPLLVIRAIYGMGFGVVSTIIPTLVSQIIPPTRMGEGIGYFGLSSSLAMSVGPALGMSIMKQSGFTTLTIIGAGAVLCIFPMLLLSGIYKLGGRRKAVLSSHTGTKAVSKAGLEASAETGLKAGSEVELKAGAETELKARSKAALEARPVNVDRVAVSKASDASQAPASSVARSVWRKEILFPALLNALLSVTYSGILSFIAIYGEVLQLAQVGLFFMFNALTILLVRPFAGKMFDRKGPVIVLIPAALSVISSILVLSYTSSMLMLIISALLHGLGFGAIQPTLQAWMLRSASQEEYGAVNGIFYNATDVGISLGAIVLGLIATLTSYEMMYRLSSLFMVAFILAMIYFIRKTKQLHVGEAKTTEANN